MYDYTIEEESNDPLFYFKTVFDYTFQVKLIKYPTGINAFGDTYSISVDCLDENYPKKDIRVGETVYKILFDFLSLNDSSLLMYVCELEDKKAHLRQRKFSCWHSLYSDGTYELAKFDVDILGTDLKYYSAIIFNPQHYSSDLINNSFNSEVTSMNEHK